MALSWTQIKGQLPVGLIAQLVEHFIATTEISPIQAFLLLLRNPLLPKGFPIDG